MSVVNPVAELRALLAQFGKSGLKDLYLRNGEWGVFLAQPGGGTNPMRQRAITPVQTLAVTAPHLGLFEPACTPGDDLAIGALLGMIDVLGRKTEVVTGAAGRVAAVHFGTGDLVQFGETLVEIATGIQG